MLHIEGIGSVTEQACRLMTQVNLMGGINIAQEMAKGLIEAKRGGAIVFMSSQVGQIALEGMAAYSATKAGMEAIARVERKCRSGAVVDWLWHARGGRENV